MQDYFTWASFFKVLLQTASLCLPHACLEPYHFQSAFSPLGCLTLAECSQVMVLANKWPFLGCLVVGFWVRFWICLPVHTLCLAVQLASNKNCCTVMTGR